MDRWYCAATQPQREVYAAQNVMLAGFDVFLPRYALAGKGKTELRPLFPSYLFVRLDLSAPWVSVNFCRGIRRLLPLHSTIPEPIRSDLIDELMEQSEGGVIPLRAADEILNRFATGDRLKVLNGPFGGLTGTYQGGQGERVRVLLALFGRPVSVTFRADQVAAYQP